MAVSILASRLDFQAAMVASSASSFAATKLSRLIASLAAFDR
jgi:hypothetical protein